MPPTTTKEHQRERDRIRSARWRARHPERAREASNRSSQKRSGTQNPTGQKPKKEKTECPKQAKAQVRIAMLKSRLAYLRAKTQMQNDSTHGSDAPCALTTQESG